MATFLDFGEARAPKPDPYLPIRPFAGRYAREERAIRRISA
jgi:hypothetical protein